jgi:hypothetical protein
MPAAATTLSHSRQPSNGVGETAFSRRITPIMAARTRANRPLAISLSDELRAMMATGGG